MSSSQNDNNPQAGQGRPLPKKDQDVFRQVVKHYETKQYKKGIKSADSILKKFPRHGETLCMKGLILNCMSKGSGAASGAASGASSGDSNSKRDEAIAMVKLGLMNDMRSHVCWHVYGLIYRSERNYNEAIKAYKQALRIDTNNIQILRDLSLLQIQMRDLDGFVKTRHSILELKSNQKTNWLTFALSKQLLGHVDEAINIIDIYLDTLKEDANAIEGNGNSNGNADPNGDSCCSGGTCTASDDDAKAATSNAANGDACNTAANANPATSNANEIDLSKLNKEFQCNYESSELALYKNMLICEKIEQQQQSAKSANNDIISTVVQVDYSEPYAHLLSIRHLIKDQYSFLQTKAYYHLHMRQFNQAKSIYMQLFDEYGSTEDYNIHSGYMTSVLKLDSQLFSNYHSLIKHHHIVKKQVKGARTIATILPLLTQHQKDTLMQEYKDTLLVKYPKSPTVQRIPLTLLDYNSDEWKLRIQAYIQRQLKRGVPSLGSDLASLFLIQKQVSDVSTIGGTSTVINGVGGVRSVGKNAIDTYYAIATDPSDIENDHIYQYISNLIDEYINSLEKTSKFTEKSSANGNGNDNEINDDNNNIEMEPPSTLLWTWYLRAVLYDLTGQYSKGIEATKKCLEQTPTAVDIYELQGKLYKHAGDINKAASATNEGRLLDKQDRYINNQTVKYLLQAGKEKEALDTIALFTRHESNPEQNIFDMQYSWYEMEVGNCYKQKGNLGKALKNYVAIEKHFEDFNEDQFDFHAYCIRKVTLRSYVQVLRWEDNLWGHDIYADAAEAIISAYLNLFDHPPKLDDEDKEPDYSKMTPAERKKAKAQARKKKKKAEKKAEEDAKKAEEAAKEKKKNGKTAVDQPPKDKDPDGKELLKMDPLEQAKKYISTLVKNAPTRISTWLYQYDVAVRRKKYFIALQALNKAKKIQSYYDNGDVFTRMVDFANLDIKAHDNAHVQEVFESEKSTLFDGKSLSDFVSSVADEAKNSKSNLSVQVAVAKAMTRVGVGSAKEACDIITSKGLNVHGATLSTCADSVQYLKDLGGDDDEYVKNARDEWIGKLKSRYFLTTLF